jgi:hypothetical protein
MSELEHPDGAPDSEGSADGSMPPPLPAAAPPVTPPPLPQMVALPARPASRSIITTLLMVMGFIIFAIVSLAVGVLAWWIWSQSQALVQTRTAPVQPVPVEAIVPQIEPVPAAPVAQVISVEPDFVSLFDGQSLGEWVGDANVWSVQDGVIRGRTTGKAVASVSTGLFWQGKELDDFEFRFAFRVNGANNSGIIYRARQLDNFASGGYQYEILRGGVGRLFDTGADRTRRDLWRTGRTVTGWHEAAIIVSGRHIIHKLDGAVICDVSDDDSRAPLRGWLALELAGAPTTAEFKNLRLKRGAPEPSPTPPPAPALAAAPTAVGPGWQTLFDGTSLDAWQGWKGVRWIGAWTVTEQELRSMTGGTIDLATREQFGDFELELEWKIRRGANSGILYRARPGPGEIWKTAPEYQIVDDDTQRDGKTPIIAAGSIYGVVPPVSKDLKPAGEFNASRIIARGTKVEHWLNGVKILDADLADPEVRRLALEKYSDPAWGQAASGHIVLQNLGSEASFRNIRVRRLE